MPASATALYHFASDNTAGICPEAWDAMAAANTGFEPSYGTDRHTGEACELFRRFFETDCEVFFVFNGTAANSLALASLCQPYHSVITHESSHVETDECGAPEFFSNGTKLLLAGGAMGKLDAGITEALIIKRTDIHFPKPRALSVSQPTEFGTRYTPDELSALSSVARRHGLRMHMDGARFFHAIVASGHSPADLTWRAGVDVLCFGGTKAGIGTSEAVVFFDKNAANEFEYRCKQAGQLASKMRFLASPWIPFLRDQLYVKHSRHAIECAQRLASHAAGIPGARLLFPVEANSAFLDLPDAIHARLHEKGWKYYRFIGGGARFMCSWQAKFEDVDQLAADMRGC